MQDQPYRVREENDEIDLRELIRSLWDQRWIVIGVAALVTVVAALYAFMATPYYRVQSILRPVEVGALDALNATGVYELTPQEALARVSSGLSSYVNRFEFFQNNQALFGDLAEQGATVEQAFEDFNGEAFAMLYPDPKKNQGEFVGLALTYPDSIEGVSVVNEFVAYVLENERQRVADDLAVVIANRKANIEQRIEAARASYQASKEAEIARLLEEAALQRAQLEDELRALRAELKIRRENRLSQLEEAIRIARSLGIHKPTTPTAMADTGEGIRTEINNREIPLYFMGVQALEAERDVLKARTNDDFMEPRIGEIQKKTRHAQAQPAGRDSPAAEGRGPLSQGAGHLAGGGGASGRYRLRCVYPAVGPPGPAGPAAHEASEAQARARPRCRPGAGCHAGRIGRLAAQPVAAQGKRSALERR